MKDWGTSSGSDRGAKATGDLQSRPAASFTPGPWVFSGVVELNDGLPCVTDADGLVVCAVVDDGKSEEICEANARLIASAPDMYAALVAARDEVEFCRAIFIEYRHANPGHLEETTQANIARADARIAQIDSALRAATLPVRTGDDRQLPERE